MLRTLQRILATALVILGALLATTTVFGHADYDRSTPGRNEVLAEPPSRVDVFFTQEVRKLEGANFVRVFNDTREQVSTGDGVVDDGDRTHIFAEIPTPLAPGRYIVEWLSLSDADGDDDNGSFCFYVATQPTAEQQAECAQFDAEQGITPGPPATEPAAQPTPTPTEAEGPPTPTPSAPEPTATAVAAEEDDDGGAPVGAIVGGVVGGVIVLGLIAGGVAVWLRRRSA